VSNASTRSIVSIYVDPSQVDDPVYEALAMEPADRTVSLVYWNDYGSTRSHVDPELGQVPVFPSTEGITSRVTRTWVDSRTADVSFVARAALDRSPHVVIINDIPTRQKFALARRLRRRGVRVGYRSDKNILSEGARTGLPWLLERQLYRAHFDHLFYIGHLTREYYNWPSSEGTLFPYATDAVKFSPQAGDKALRRKTRATLGVPADAFVVLCVAKFVDRENPLDVVRACLAALRSVPNLFLVAVGSGVLLSAIHALVTDQDAADRVRLPGYVPYAQLQDYFFAADLFVHLANREPWGVSVSDALCAGLGVVASDCVGSGREFLQGRLEKYLVPVGRPMVAADLIVELSHCGDIAAEFASARRVAASYTARATAQRLAHQVT
jgi:glycosyltransferase involved in cell wall biosynthesis